MARFLRAALLAAYLSTSVFAAQSPCGPGSACPSDSPCCSAYGQCGVGAYCLGGCDPRYSFDLKSCAPAPVCQSQDYKLTSLNDIADISTYLGDTSKTNWVASGKPVAYNNNAILLTMAPDTVGTLVSSTHYVWYGKIEATLTTSIGAGVVTAFILMSDSKDEIDYEFVGVDLNHAQTNFYSQGVTNYNNEVNISASSTNTQTHTYAIDWTTDQITWSVDGNVLRTKKRSETWNSTSNRWDFPQTPSRVQISLWPAGLPSAGKGTIDWAGGLVDWNSPDMKNGYYYAIFNEIKITCYDPPAGADVQGKKSYIYKDTKATNQSIQITDSTVILQSLYATGDNPGTQPNAAQSSNSPQTVPGVSGIGTRGDLPGGSSNAASGSNVTAGSTTSFTQGTTKSGALGKQQSLRTGGSAFAVLVAIVLVCVWL
ncbi:glycosyl hydrolases family 16 protein [Microthyrium microscopicum]|uniref:Crh-like protein n=1 Tax=Microthyrium microscopicum TaxID=703497 RepID=A0A6A6U437_9PEZI|nr:glycosyl hydrolases family 16 protein [Microthyrium microscopicum]